MQRQGGCHTDDSGRKRDFIVAPYFLDEGAGWTTSVPDGAPCGPGCQTRRHSERERRTGPAHPLLVIRCAAHDRCFTVYPTGYVPFGRRRLVPRKKRWEVTLFEAALDASEGERWSDVGLEGWWPTQWRHLLRLGELLGLRASERVGEQVAHELGMDLHAHAEARAEYGVGGFRRRGRAVVAVLDAVRRAGSDALRRLLRAGRVAGCWGRAYWADPRWGLRPLAPF